MGCGGAKAVAADSTSAGRKSNVAPRYPYARPEGPTAWESLQQSSQPASAVGGFLEGELAEVYSHSKDMWLTCVVKEVFLEDTPLDDGVVPKHTIKVEFSAGLKYIAEADIGTELRKAGTDVLGPHDGSRKPPDVKSLQGFSEGELAEIWNQRKGMWLPCAVRAIFFQTAMDGGELVPKNTIKVETEFGVRYVSDADIPVELRHVAKTGQAIGLGVASTSLVDVSLRDNQRPSAEPRGSLGLPTEEIPNSNEEEADANVPLFTLSLPTSCPPTEVIDLASTPSARSSTESALEAVCKRHCSSECASASRMATESTWEGPSQHAARMAMHQTSCHETASMSPVTCGNIPGAPGQSSEFVEVWSPRFPSSKMAQGAPFAAFPCMWTDADAMDCVVDDARYQLLSMVPFDYPVDHASTNLSIRDVQAPCSPAPPYAAARRLSQADGARLQRPSVLLPGQLVFQEESAWDVQAPGLPAPLYAATRRPSPKAEDDIRKLDWLKEYHESLRVTAMGDGACSSSLGGGCVGPMATDVLQQHQKQSQPPKPVPMPVAPWRDSWESDSRWEALSKQMRHSDPGARAGDRDVTSAGFGALGSSPLRASGGRAAVAGAIRAPLTQAGAPRKAAMVSPDKKPRAKMLSSGNLIFVDKSASVPRTYAWGGVSALGSSARPAARARPPPSMHA